MHFRHFYSDKVEAGVVIVQKLQPKVPVWVLLFVRMRPGVAGLHNGVGRS